jgi:hypothetical protein
MIRWSYVRVVDMVDMHRTSWSGLPMRLGSHCIERVRLQTVTVIAQMRCKS